MHHADANIRRYDAVRDVLAANPDLAVDLAMHLEPDDDLIVIRLADELGAVVVHFVAGIGSRVFFIDVPKRVTRRRVAVLCQRIGEAWVALGYSDMGTTQACAELAGEPRDA